MPGGLSRVTPSLDNLVVSVQLGGGSKDTWVLGGKSDEQLTLLPPKSRRLAVSRATFDLPSRVADNLFWLGRYVERVEAVVRVTRSMLPRLTQENDPMQASGLRAGARSCSITATSKAKERRSKRSFSICSMTARNGAVWVTASI